MKKTWKDDHDFVNWLLQMKYVKKEKGALSLSLAEGLYNYMYEAYILGKKPAPQNISKLDPYDYPFELASFQGVF
ncbi:hypothetical protein DRH13_00250 [Candidatus Woesebacteria bacterium]|nr:MAG: hypothetical protein DRH13_00250 [Candidatus Woesebacteria bacterium]